MPTGDGCAEACGSRQTSAAARRSTLAEACQNNNVHAQSCPDATRKPDDVGNLIGSHVQQPRKSVHPLAQCTVHRMISNEATLLGVICSDSQQAHLEQDLKHEGTRESFSSWSTMYTDQKFAAFHISDHRRPSAATYTILCDPTTAWPQVATSELVNITPNLTQIKLDPRVIQWHRRLLFGLPNATTSQARDGNEVRINKLLKRPPESDGQALASRKGDEVHNVRA